MTNLLNFDAESGANAIFDDTGVGFTFKNTSSGRAVDVEGTTGSAVRTKVSTGKANATTRNALEMVGASVASGAIVGLINASSYVSTTTIQANEAVAADCGAVRIVKPDGTFGWLPVYPDSAVTGVAV